MDTAQILVVFGARPSVIKLAPVVHALRRRGATVNVCHTGQHGHMLECCLEPLGIEVTHRLDAQHGGLAFRLGTMTSALGTLLARNPHDAVVVVGDTVSGLVGALAGAFAGTPVAHVEAGLRTYCREPWPEEMTRKAIDSMARWFFAPTQRAADNLEREGVDTKRVFVTGNTIVDALELMGQKRRRSPHPAVLITVHRRENWRGIEKITRQVCGLADTHPNVAFRWPVHLNPAIREPVFRVCGRTPNISLLDPLPYGEFLGELSRAWLVITDSGGVQEESATLGVPSVILRQVTERPEAVDAGVSVLAGGDFALLADAILRDDARRARMNRPSQCFGDGWASERIAAIMLNGKASLVEPAETKGPAA